MSAKAMKTSAKIFHRIKIAGAAVALVAFSALGTDIAISGTVKDSDNKPIPGARIRIVDAGISTVAGSDGAYQVQGTLSAKALRYAAYTSLIALQGCSVRLTLAEKQYVRMELFDVRGRRVLVLADGRMPAGETRINMPHAELGSRIHLLRLRTGSRFASYRLLPLDGRFRLHKTHGENSGSRRMAKRGATEVIGYVVASHGDYKGEGVAITEENATVNFTLTKLICPKITPTIGPMEYEIVSPNGGEVFYTGEVCTLKVAAGKNANGTASLIFGPDGLMSFAIPGLANSFNPARDSIQPFTVPEFFLEERWDEELQKIVADTIPAVSDSCIIELLDYDPTGYGDYSDCFFTIKKR